MNDHAMLDDVAVYALGALPPAEAQRVREHMATCPQCQEEYAQLTAAATAVGLAAETSGNAATCPSTLLKPRIMRLVRADAAKPAEIVKPKAKPVWPAYLVAAACLAFALITSAWNLALNGRLNSQAQVTEKHYVIASGEIVTRGDRIYMAMRSLPAPPPGKVYQAWTLAKGEKRVAPSVTFVPDVHGTTLVALPVDASSLAAVAISVEPEGGSKQPTSKPIAVVPLT